MRVREALELISKQGCLTWCFVSRLSFTACRAGTYQALITVCKRNKQGEKSLLVYEVGRGKACVDISCDGFPTLHRLSSIVVLSLSLISRAHRL